MANQSVGRSESEHKHIDAASYDSAASAFDQLSERFSAPLAERLLDLAELGPGARVLDVGVGTGLVAVRAAARPGVAKVLGIDHSAGMLDAARGKARALGLASLCEFAAMDAEAMELEAGAFDRIVSLFVLLHLPNPQKGLEEFHRVLSPGGRVAIGVGSGPTLLSMQGMAAGVRQISGRIRTAAGRQLEAPAFLRGLMAERGLAGPEHTHDHRHIDIAAGLRQAGFHGVSSHWIGDSVALSPEDFWSVQAIIGSSERIRLAELAADQVEALREAFMARARAVQAAGGRLVYKFGARVFCAVR